MNSKNAYETDFFMFCLAKKIPEKPQTCSYVSPMKTNKLLYKLLYGNRT